MRRPRTPPYAPPPCDVLDSSVPLYGLPPGRSTVKAVKRLFALPAAALTAGPARPTPGASPETAPVRRGFALLPSPRRSQDPQVSIVCAALYPPSEISMVRAALYTTASQLFIAPGVAHGSVSRYRPVWAVFFPSAAEPAPACIAPVPSLSITPSRLYGCGRSTPAGPSLWRAAL